MPVVARRDDELYANGGGIMDTMKSIPNPLTTGDEKLANFTRGLRKVMRVDKDELQRREAEYQAERATKPKRGPKPKASA